MTLESGSSRDDKKQSVLKQMDSLTPSSPDKITGEEINLFVEKNKNDPRALTEVAQEMSKPENLGKLGETLKDSLGKLVDTLMTKQAPSGNDQGVLKLYYLLNAPQSQAGEVGNLEGQKLLETVQGLRKIEVRNQKTAEGGKYITEIENTLKTISKESDAQKKNEEGAKFLEKCKKMTLSKGDLNDLTPKIDAIMNDSGTNDLIKKLVKDAISVIAESSLANGYTLENKQDLENLKKIAGEGIQKEMTDNETLKTWNGDERLVISKKKGQPLDVKTLMKDGKIREGIDVNRINTTDLTAFEESMRSGMKNGKIDKAMLTNLHKAFGEMGQLGKILQDFLKIFGLMLGIDLKAASEVPQSRLDDAGVMGVLDRMTANDSKYTFGARGNIQYDSAGKLNDQGGEVQQQFIKDVQQLTKIEPEYKNADTTGPADPKADRKYEYGPKTIEGVKRIQEVLIEKGYLKSKPLDGVFDGELAKSYQEFLRAGRTPKQESKREGGGPVVGGAPAGADQKENNLPEMEVTETGDTRKEKASKDYLKSSNKTKLRALYAELVRSQSDKDLPTDYKKTSELFKKALEHPDETNVRSLQQDLNEYQDISIIADGQFGGSTLEAARIVMGLSEKDSINEKRPQPQKHSKK